MYLFEPKPYGITQSLKDKTPKFSAQKIEKMYQEYALILWLGDNGLRLNDDGTSEWINKYDLPHDSAQGRPFRYLTEWFPNNCGPDVEIIIGIEYL